MQCFQITGYMYISVKISQIPLKLDINDKTLNDEKDFLSKHVFHIEIKICFQLYILFLDISIYNVGCYLIFRHKLLSKPCLGFFNFRIIYFPVH